MTQEKQPDYTSRVPRFTFANTLPEQEAQLAANPLVQRFAESRRQMAADRYRPMYHYVSPESGMNDPNGLCFWQGKWHLFYQGYPPEDTRQHWGHAVSTDLVHWEDLPYAIYPDPEKCCFSGSTLVEEDRVIAMYHGTECGNMVAVSDDPLLLNWTKVTGDAVIKPEDFPDVPRIFDPCIWKQGDHYYSLSAGVLPNEHGDRQHRADFIFRSKDLATWEYLGGSIIEGDYWNRVGDDGACPYFWPIGDKHALIHFSHMSGGHWLVGDYDTERQKLCVSNGGDFTFGPVGGGSIHAPSACPAPDGSGDLICIFNVNPGKPTSPWNQIMSLPRRLSLYDGDCLAQEPAGDIESLRGERASVRPMDLASGVETVLDGIDGDCLELDMELDPQGASFVELNVLRSPGKEEFTRIAFYRNRGMRTTNHRVRPHTRDSIICLDTTYSSELPDAHVRLPEEGPFPLAADETVKLRIFIDRSIVEVFANGKQCVAERVYPGRVDATGVAIRAWGGQARLLKLDAYQMNSIYG